MDIFSRSENDLKTTTTTNKHILETFFSLSNETVQPSYVRLSSVFVPCLCVRYPGLSPDLQSMEQVRRVMRPTDVPDQGLLCDLLWADPDKDVLGWGENDRGVSFTFGADVVAKFLHKHDMDLICRAHQVNTCGYSVWEGNEWGGW